MSIPQTSPYRQGILQAWVGEHRLIRRVASGHEYAHVKLCVEPLKNGARFDFSEEVTASGSLPARFLSHIEIGALGAAEKGLWGFPLDSFRIRVVDGSYHDVDSTPPAFEEASRLALLEAMAAAQPVIVEPCALITVRAPANYAGAVTQNLTAHRGEIRATRPSTWFEIDALLPQTEVSECFSAVAWSTNGGGTFSIISSEFRQVPDSLIADLYCGVCRHTMRMPLLRGEPFADKCLICGSPFEPPLSQMSVP
jgi:elongation factor G